MDTPVFRLVEVDEVVVWYWNLLPEGVWQVVVLPPLELAKQELTLYQPESVV